MADLVGQILGSYRIESLLGAGGMGEVYRAVHVHLNRPAAIKVLRPQQATDPTFQARFLREARAAAALSHPNIVEVFDFGEQAGLAFLVMELVPDGSLRSLLQKRSAGQGWTLGLGVDLVRQAAEGLAYAHSHGMVHRDIKPDNLLLQRRAPSEQGSANGQYLLKISDFGLARLIEDHGELTVTGMVMGTPAYMSPEQCQGGVLDGRSDLYSLGVVLYEVATGSPPFRAKTLSEAVFKHVSVAPVPPREVRPDLPATLEAVIMRCLEKRPADRFASAAELVKALDGALGETELKTVVTGQDDVRREADAKAQGADHEATVSASRLPVPLPRAQLERSPARFARERSSRGQSDAAGALKWPRVGAGPSDSARSGEPSRRSSRAMLARPWVFGLGGVSALLLVAIISTLLATGVLPAKTRGSTAPRHVNGHAAHSTPTPRPGTVTEYPLPTARSGPHGITRGPDGALWFTEYAASKIGRITTDGKSVAEYPTLTAKASPFEIVSGPDGALWFTETTAVKIGRITTDGKSVAEYSIPTASATPYGIASGQDGALWFAEGNASKIGRITTGGSITEYLTLTPNSGPNKIASGPDGALWFTEGNASKIGRITTGGSITEYPLPTARSGPYRIASGPDGAIWFTAIVASKIGRITTDGKSVAEYPTLTPGAGPVAIESGPDGAMWFAESAAGKIGRIVP